MMKTTKSPEETEVTPSKKKLKQARLPFKLISDTTPSDALQGRKRKLSAPDAPEPVTKIGKISNENDLSECLVISDDDIEIDQKSEKEDKPLNPYVKLVDTVWKKKLQKKITKKRKSKKITKETINSSVENVNDSALEISDQNIDLMDVDNEEEAVKSEYKHGDESKESSVSNNSAIPENNVVVLEDSNHSSVINQESQEVEIVQNVEQKETDSHDNSEVESANKPEDISVTPKRSARNKAKLDQINTTPSSKLNDSVCSETTTPKQKSRSSSVSTSVGDESVNDLSSTNLTPKQLQKKLDSAKKKEERDKQKLDRELKRQQEKDEKAKQKQEKEEIKRKEREEKEEAKRKEKEEKEELKRKEREEKERQREFEKKLKEEKEELKRKEREEKEDQRRKEKEAREEEKRKKQEALEQEKQDQELKKKKAAEAFVNFFVPKQKVEKDQTTVCTVSKNSMLSSFTIKSDMRLAPTVRVDFSDDKKQVLDVSLETQNESMLYLGLLKTGTSKPLSSGKTWKLTDKDDDDDIMIVEDELPMDGAGEIITCDSVPREKLRPKLLSFHENRRPPYWGTWRKKSAFVKPRRPFAQDEKQLDYEVDSDDDWEEEQEGESIDGSAAGSDDEQDADEYEVDNEVFVPHGYLSDEEATMDEDDVLSLSPETQKARLKYLEDEFESEMKKPTEKIKPRMYGLLWETSEGGKPDNCVDALWNYFGKLSMIMNDPKPFLQPSNESEETEKKKVKKKKVATEGDQESPKTEKAKKAKSENKKPKKNDTEFKKNTPEVKKNQPGINSFLKKLKTS